MGLDFRMSDGRHEVNGVHPRWSYSGFDSFRKGLASVIGLDLGTMQGHGGLRSWSSVIDPIVPLLHHSDCDGELAPDVCRTVAPRLRALAAKLPHDYDRSMGAALADMMDECARTGASLEFR